MVTRATTPSGMMVSFKPQRIHCNLPGPFAHESVLPAEAAAGPAATAMDAMSTGQ